MGVLEGLEEVVECLSTGSISIERRSGSSIDSDGNPIRGILLRRTIDPAVVHVASGRELLRLPEGDRVREVITVITQTRLRTAQAGGGKEADVVLYSSQPDELGRYVVRVSEDWDGASGHYSCLAVRRESE